MSLSPSPPSRPVAIGKPAGVQMWSKKLAQGLVNFVPAVAYHSCLNLPAGFSQPGNGNLAHPCKLFACYRINSLGLKIVIVHSAGGTVNEVDELKCLFRGRISIPISTSSTSSKRRLTWTVGMHSTSLEDTYFKSSAVALLSIILEFQRFKANQTSNSNQIKGKKTI